MVLKVDFSPYSTVWQILLACLIFAIDWNTWLMYLYSHPPPHTFFFFVNISCNVLIGFGEKIIFLLELKCLNVLNLWLNLPQIHLCPKKQT